MGTAALGSVAESVRAGADHLLRLQREDGHWCGPLHSNACIEAEYVMLAHCLGLRNPSREVGVRKHLLQEQGADGAWRVYPGGPGDLNCTVEAYQALKLLGLPAESEPLRRARRFVLAAGGVPRTRVFTRVWLALLGQYPWAALPVLPPEAILLPPWCPLNIYDFASWARATVVPMSLLMSRRPVFPVSADQGVPELYPPAGQAAPPKRAGAWEAVFRAVDAVLHLYHRLPWHPGRALAERRALTWILEHQEEDGTWGGIQPPWFYSLLALQALSQAEHPALARGVAALERFGVTEPDGRWWLQACVSPVWDTALAVLALRAAGLPAEHQALRRAGEWLCERQVFAQGDWRVRRPHAPAGGWPFEYANQHYPDIDDTAVVLLALSRLRLRDDDRRKRALTAGFRWLVAMQSRNGGWAAFDADNTRTLCARIPFCDFGAVTDPPTEDVTGHVLECLGAFGYDEAFAPVRRGIAFLRRSQRADGSWFGRWGVNHVYGTGAVLPGVVAAGIDPAADWVQRAADWLERHQNDDGGFGEGCASYVDAAQCGRGESTPSQTAWGLIGLLAAGRAGSDAAARAAAHLVRTQRGDGGWDEASYTGTGFPGDFYIGYGLYRNVFPVLALGRYRLAAKGEPA